MMRKIFVVGLMLFCNIAFALGDTSSINLGFVLSLAALFFVVIILVIYFCLKIAGRKQRLKWVLLGGLPSIVCAILFSWLPAFAIAFGVAFWLQHTAERKQRNSETIDYDK